MEQTALSPAIGMARIEFVTSSLDGRKREEKDGGVEDFVEFILLCLICDFI